MSDLVKAVKAIRAARPDLDTAEDYYEGRVPELFPNERLAAILQSEDGSRDFRLNYARVPVSAFLELLDVAAWTSQDQAMQDTIDRVVSYNDLALVHLDLHEKMLYHGLVYALVWPVVPDNPDDSITDVEVTLEPATIMRVFYDPEHPRRPLFAAKLWEHGSGKDKRLRLNLYYPDRLEKYVTRADGCRGEKEDEWRPWIDHWRDAEPGELIKAPDGRTVEAEGGEQIEVWPVVNPYGIVPVFAFNTRHPYGRPIHQDAYGPQNIITKIANTFPDSLDFFALPQRVWLTDQAGAASSEETDFQDGVYDADDLEGEQPNLISRPGGVWKLEGGQFIQLAPADPRGFIDPLTAAVESMAAITEIPLSRFRQEKGVPSGESRRAEYAKMVRKGEWLRGRAAAAWQAVFRCAHLILTAERTPSALPEDGPLDLATLFPDGPPAVTTEWKPAQSWDDKDRAQAIELLDRAGAVSTETKVRMARPDLSDPEVQAEVNRIRDEQGGAMPSALPELVP